MSRLQVAGIRLWAWSHTTPRACLFWVPSHTLRLPCRFFSLTRDRLRNCLTPRQHRDELRQRHGSTRGQRRKNRCTRTHVNELPVSITKLPTTERHVGQQPRLEGPPSKLLLTHATNNRVANLHTMLILVSFVNEMSAGRCSLASFKHCWRQWPSAESMFAVGVSEALNAPLPSTPRNEHPDPDKLTGARMTRERHDARDERLNEDNAELVHAHELEETGRRSAQSTSHGDDES